MTFIPTNDLDLPAAKAQRKGLKRDIVAVLVDADNWLSAETIAARVEMGETLARNLCQELTGELLEQRAGYRGRFMWRTPDAWVVKGCTSTVVHDDHECEHIWTFDARPADADEVGAHTACEDCSAQSRTDTPEQAAYRSAREAADD